MGKDDFLLLVTSPEWRAQLASFFLGKLSPEELRKCGEHESFARWFFNGDPYAGVQHYTSRNKPLPPAIGRAILEDRKIKKGGRHSHPEQLAAQKASDAACFVAMQYLREAEPNLSQTAAGERVGKLMCLSCPAVVRAWKKELQLLENASETHT